MSLISLSPVEQEDRQENNNNKEIIIIVRQRGLVNRYPNTRQNKFFCRNTDFIHFDEKVGQTGEKDLFFSIIINFETQ